MTDVAAVVFGIGFPAMFFPLCNGVVMMILGGQMREIKHAAATTSQQTGSRWRSATVR
jgi:hypothetical protein